MKTQKTGGAFRSYNQDPCPACGWRNKDTKKCEVPKGYYCKLLRNTV